MAPPSLAAASQTTTAAASSSSKRGDGSSSPLSASASVSASSVSSATHGSSSSNTKRRLLPKWGRGGKKKGAHASAATSSTTSNHTPLSLFSHHHRHHHPHPAAPAPAPPAPVVSASAAAVMEGMLQEVAALFHADRLIAAATALEALEARVAADRASLDVGVREAAEGFWRERVEGDPTGVGKLLGRVRKRGRECRELLAESHTTEGWSLVSEHGATRTYWQPAAAGGKEGGPEEAGVGGGDGGGGGGNEHLVRVRVEGHVDCSVMEQLAVIREAQNYKRWMPLCQDSRLVHREGNADQLVWFQLGVPRVFALDVLLEAYGADLMVEDGCVVIVGQSVTAAHPPDRPLKDGVPEPPKGLFGWRVELRDFKVLFKVDSPRASRVMISFVLDPHLRSTWATDAVSFCIKRTAGLSLHYLRRHAERIVRDKEAHPLFSIMKEERFYKEIMAPRVGRYGKVHYPHEDAPPILYALGYDVPAIMAADPYGDNNKSNGKEEEGVVVGGRSEEAADAKTVAAAAAAGGGPAAAAPTLVVGEKGNNAPTAVAVAVPHRHPPRGAKQRSLLVVAATYVGVVLLTWLLPRFLLAADRNSA